MKLARSVTLTATNAIISTSYRFIKGMGKTNKFFKIFDWVFINSKINKTVISESEDCCKTIYMLIGMAMSLINKKHFIKALKGKFV